MYPAGGSHYVRHMDASKGTLFAWCAMKICSLTSAYCHARTGRAEARLLTFVYYANPDWIPAHGGQLRAYLDSGSVTVEPRADRLVVFQVQMTASFGVSLHHAI